MFICSACKPVPTVVVPSPSPSPTVEIPSPSPSVEPTPSPSPSPVFGPVSEENRNIMAALEHVGISSIELDKQMTREQFAVFFVKLIDRNETALKEQFQHPFTDSTPDGDPYLGYVYARWYYTGTEDYSASGNITGKEVLLAILRAMGYSDNRGGTDFSADDPSVLAASLGLTVPDDDIRGEDIAALVWQALGAKTKDEKTFADKLDIDDDLIKEAEYLAKGQPIPSPSPSPSPSPKKEKEPQKENNNSGGGNSGGGN